jgi:hypothetical protein
MYPKRGPRNHAASRQLTSAPSSTQYVEAVKRCRRGHQPEDISQISTTTDHARTREPPISVARRQNMQIMLATLNTRQHDEAAIVNHHHEPAMDIGLGDTHSGCSACLNTHCDSKVCQQYLASAPFQSRGRDTGNLLTTASRLCSGCCFWRARNEGIQKQGARPGQAATLTRIRSRGRGRADRKGKGPKTSTTRRKIGSHRSLPVPICVSPNPLRPFSGFDIDMLDSSGQATSWSMGSG